jgi:hypothetical protein
MLRGVAIADDAPAEKAEKVAPAAPTAPTAVSKEDAAAGDEVVREARSFLSLLRDAADEKAYERMSGEFRKEHTAEQFAKDAADFREKLPLPASIGANGDVWLKPKDGGPPRASLRAGMPLGMVFSGAGRGGLSRPPMSAMTLSLVREDGKWKVASLQDVRATRSGAIGKSPKFDRKDPDRIKVSSTLEGKITKFDDGSLVLRLGGGQNDQPASERTLKVDEQTVVMLATQGPERESRIPGAPPSRSMRYTPSTATEIKAERRATVEPSEDGTRAECVMVMQNAEPGAPAEGL